MNGLLKFLAAILLLVLIAIAMVQCYSMVDAEYRNYQRAQALRCLTDNWDSLEDWQEACQ